MKIIIILSVLLMSISFFESANSQDMKIAEQKIHSLFCKTIERDRKVHNAFLLVHSDKFGIHWSYYNDEVVDENPDDKTDYHYFHTASIGKTFTAVIIAMLYEKGMIDFNDPISKYLPEDIITGLNVYKGKDYSDKILVKHLLNHTSGVPDFYSGKSDDGVKFIDYCIKNPQKSWNPLETIKWAKKYGTSKFPPGEGFNYTDTGYQLLGLIIEKITGSEFHQALDNFIFSPLDMKHSSLWLYSEPLIKSKYPLTEVYFNKTEVSSFQSVNFDWACGGVASTSEDLLTFIKALNENTLIKAATYQKMQDWQKESKGLYYGYGLRQFRLKELFFTLPDEVITGNSGSIGSFMYYNPTYDLYLTGSFSQSKYMRKHIVFLIKVMNIISKNVYEVPMK
jgi:D-alanyl-D-alanine carboxypeptidase